MGVVEVAVAKAFSGFVEAISLNPTRDRKIRAYATSVQGFTQRDVRGLGKYIEVDPFIHGSYSYGTTVRPRAGAQEYDLDLILPLSRDFFEQYSPADALGYVRRRLATNYTTVTQGNKCVRISNEDGFHVDIVPAHMPQGNTSVVYIINRPGNELIASHPMAVTDWVNGLTSKTANRFAATVRVYKRWRDVKFGANTRPKSLLLTVLAGRAIEEVMQDSEWNRFYRSPSTTMAEFVHATAIAMLDYLGTNGGQVLVPGTDDDLGERWSREASEAFVKRLAYFQDVAENANTATTRGGALKRWQKLLGPDFSTSY